MVSLGLDTYVGDPISQFALTTEDFSTLGRRLAGLGLPTALVLEGGYAATELGPTPSRSFTALKRVGETAATNSRTHRKGEERWIKWNVWWSGRV